MRYDCAHNLSDVATCATDQTNAQPGKAWDQYRRSTRGTGLTTSPQWSAIQLRNALGATDRRNMVATLAGRSRDEPHDVQSVFSTLMRADCQSMGAETESFISSLNSRR